MRFYRIVYDYPCYLIRRSRVAVKCAGRTGIRFRRLRSYYKLLGVRVCTCIQNTRTYTRTCIYTIHTTHKTHAHTFFHRLKGDATVAFDGRLFCRWLSPSYSFPLLLCSPCPETNPSVGGIRSTLSGKLLFPSAEK